ncbi:hypothetical protein N7486_002829 [Penicillium sp. IBT 16267x]|nr:hypothetical protein N7486_002829 [Penicillium sp. IBT 16267x]
MFIELYLWLLDRRDARIVMSGDFNSIQESRLKVEKYYRWHYDGILGRGSLEKSLFRIWKLDFALRAAVQAKEYIAQHKLVLSQRSHVQKSDIDLLAEKQSITAQVHVLLRRALIVRKRSCRVGLSKEPIFH